MASCTLPHSTAETELCCRRAGGGDAACGAQRVPPCRARGGAPGAATACGLLITWQAARVRVARLMLHCCRKAPATPTHLPHATPPACLTGAGRADGRSCGR